MRVCLAPGLFGGCLHCGLKVRIGGLLGAAIRQGVVALILVQARHGELFGHTAVAVPFSGAVGPDPVGFRHSQSAVNEIPSAVIDLQIPVVLVIPIEVTSDDEQGLALERVPAPVNSVAQASLMAVTAAAIPMLPGEIT